VRVCRIDEILGDELRGFQVAGVTWPVMVATVDGELVAFPGVCPHDDVSLVDYGVIEGNELRCRVHGYRFDVPRPATASTFRSSTFAATRFTIADGELWSICSDVYCDAVTEPLVVVRSRRVVLDTIRPATIHIRGGVIEKIADYIEVPARSRFEDYGELAILLASSTRMCT